MQRYYEKYWEDETILSTSPYLNWKNKIIKSLNLGGNNFLDVGCGDGILMQNLSKKFKLYGVDISDYALKKALERGFCSTQVVDLNNFGDLPYDDNFFDNISCLDVLEHILEPEVIVKEIYRVLKDDGTFIVCVPNILNIYNRIKFLFGEFVDALDVAHTKNELFSEHIRMFSKKKLEILLQKAGFTIEKRYSFFTAKFTNSDSKALRIIGFFYSLFNLKNIKPSLFSFGFTYVCKK